MEKNCKDPLLTIEYLAKASQRSGWTADSMKKKLPIAPQAATGMAPDKEAARLAQSPHLPFKPAIFTAPR